MQKKVLVGGCVDLIHYGHVSFLKQAKAYGDCLIVALESDENVRGMKGNTRPIHTQLQRKRMLEALTCVDEVIELPPMKTDEEYAALVVRKQSIDEETGQVAPMLAEALGVPFVSLVNKIEELGESAIKVIRMSDEGHQVIEMALPGVITVVKEINVPRIPSLRGLMAAKKAKIPVWNAQELGIDAATIGTAGSPTRVAKVFFPQRPGKSEMLQGSPESQVDQLVNRLRQTGAM